MAWVDRLLPGSFAGVTFYVDEYEFATGRKGVQKVFPQQDKPRVEDLGRAPREFSIAAYLIGDDYDLDRDKLATAFEARSVAFPTRVTRSLRHPYLGVLEVYASRARFRESRREGGICTVTMTFLEASETVFPATSSRVGTAAADAASEQLVDAAEVDAAEDLVSEKVPQSVLQSTADALKAYGSKLQSLDVFAGATQDVAALADAAQQLVADGVALAIAPAKLITTATKSLDLILGTAATAAGALEAYKALFDLELDVDPIGDSANAKNAAKNAEAVRDLFRAAALGGAVRAAARRPWDFLGQATGERERLLERADILRAVTGTASGVVPALMQALAQAVPGPAADLPQVRTLATVDALPALVVSYRLYSKPGEADAIARRNKAPHPGFLPAGELEVLSRA